MFAVIFEVTPKQSRWEDYLGYAQALKPELEKIEGFLDNERFESRTREPPAVKIPGGAFQDVFDAWAGELAYDPALIRAPLAIIRGEWDSYSTDADASWLFDRLKASPLRRDVKIARATHLMHLEETRYALYREAETFLRGGDLPAPKRIT